MANLDDLTGIEIARAAGQGASKTGDGFWPRVVGWCRRNPTLATLTVVLVVQQLVFLVAFQIVCLQKAQLERQIEELHTTTEIRSAVPQHQESK